ncbi:hypothetical protein [Streptomyces sp. NPDC057690]|uniref:hypothetical protein n=1 Tax=Streptomyces sp. NPDC057690 TaxID=3346214 RepID=UPI0036992124
MSDTPEIGESLSQRIESHRAALSSLLARTGIEPSAAPAAGAAPRADVLVSAAEDPWHDGRGNDDKDKDKDDEEEKDETG